MVTLKAERDSAKRDVTLFQAERDAARLKADRIIAKLVTVRVKTYFLTSNDFLVRIQQPPLFQFFILCESVCLHNERILLNAVYSFNSLLLHLIHISIRL